MTHLIIVRTGNRRPIDPAKMTARAIELRLNPPNDAPERARDALRKFLDDNRRVG